LYEYYSLVAVLIELKTKNKKYKNCVKENNKKNHIVLWHVAFQVLGVCVILNRDTISQLSNSVIIVSK
jgi:hypothetical protein